MSGPQGLYDAAWLDWRPQAQTLLLHLPEMIFLNLYYHWMICSSLVPQQMSWLQQQLIWLHQQMVRSHQHMI